MTRALPRCMILVIRILDVDADRHEGADSESLENSLEISLKNDTYGI